MVLRLMEKPDGLVGAPKSMLCGREEAAMDIRGRGGFEWW